MSALARPSFSLPMARSSEILIEKSPQYAGGAESLRLKRAKDMVTENVVFWRYIAILALFH